MPHDPDTGLNDRQERFCHEYLKDLNGTKAAIRSGYSATSAAESASEALRNSKVIARIAEIEAPRISAADATAVAVLREYMRLGTVDARGFFDDNGDIRRPQEWTADQGAAISSFEVIIKNAKAGDGETDTVHKIRLYDKTRALESLAKHLGLLIDRLEIRGDSELMALLQEGRARAAERK